MEYKRHRQDNQPTQRASVKWLPQIVFQKEKQLATLTESIQLEELQSQCQQTTGGLEATLTQQEQYPQRFQTVRSNEQLSLQQESRASQFTDVKTKLKERRNTSSQRKLKSCSGYGSEQPSADMQLLRELQYNKQQYKVMKDMLQRLAEQMEELKQDLLTEQNKNNSLSREIKHLEESNSQLTTERDEALRQLEEAREGETKQLERIYGLKIEKEKLCGQLLQEAEKYNLLERSKVDIVQALKLQIQQLNNNIIDTRKRFEAEQKLREKIEQQLSTKIKEYENELSERAKRDLREKQDLQSQLDQCQAALNQRMFNIQNACMRAEQEKHHLKQEYELLELKHQVLENKYMVLQTQKTLKRMTEMEQPKSSKALADKNLKDQSLLLDNSSTFLKYHDNQELLSLKSELERIRSEHQLQINRMTNDLAIFSEERKQVAAQLQEQKLLRNTLQEGKLKVQEQMDQLLVVHRELQEELNSMKDQLLKARESVTKKSAEIEKLQLSIQENRKTTVSIITQKDELSKQHEALKKQFRSCTGHIEAMKILYCRSEWWLFFTEIDHLLQSKIAQAVTQWEVKYLICESVCRIGVQALDDKPLLHKLVTALQKGAINEIPLLENMLQLINFVNTQPNHLLQNPNELSIGPLNIDLSRIMSSGTEVKVQPPEQPQPIEQQLNNSDHLLKNLQRQIEDHPSAHQQTIVTDASEIKENFKMIKAVNQQLFQEVQSKEQQLKAITSRINSMQEFTVRQQHLRSIVQKLQRQVKPTDRLFELITSMGSLLNLK